MTNKGLHIQVRLLQRRETDSFIAVLDCHALGNLKGPLGLILQSVPGTGREVFMRDTRFELQTIDEWKCGKSEVRHIYIAKNKPPVRQDVKYLWIRSMPGTKKTGWQSDQLYASDASHETLVGQGMQWFEVIN